MENFTLEFEDKNIDVPFRATSCKVSDLLEHERSLAQDKMALVESKYEESYSAWINANLQREELEAKDEYTPMRSQRMALDNKQINYDMANRNAEILKINREYYVLSLRHILNFKNLVTTQKEIVKTEEFWLNQDHEKAEKALDFFIKRNLQTQNA